MKMVGEKGGIGIQRILLSLYIGLMCLKWKAAYFSFLKSFKFHNSHRKGQKKDNGQERCFLGELHNSVCLVDLLKRIVTIAGEKKLEPEKSNKTCV